MALQTKWEITIKYLISVFLKAGIGSENEQKMIITNILDSNAHVEFFAQNFFDIYNRNELIKKIYENLK